MQIKKTQVRSYGIPHELITLICTPEEFGMLKEILNAEGVNVRAIVSSSDRCEIEVLNPYRDVVEGFGNQRERQLGREFFERNERI